MTNTLLSIQNSALVHIFVLGFYGFAFSILLTPVYTTIAYKNRWWKKLRTTTLTGEKATELQKLHGEKHRRNIPTMAGLIMVEAVSAVTLLFN